MQNYETSVVLPLLKDSVLSAVDPRLLARLLPHVRQRRLSAGQALYRRGSPADALFIVQEGALLLHAGDNEQTCARVVQGHVGEEAALAGQRYLADVTADGDCALLEIPRTSLKQLLIDQPALQSAYYASLLKQYSGQRLESPEQRKAKSTKGSSSWSQIIGWMLTALAPMGVLFSGERLGLDIDALAFLAVLSSVICMWVFSLVDEYLPGLFAILATLTLGLVPVQIPLAGFASDSFFMAMSILGLGTVIVSSGLSYRCLLWLLAHMPNNRFGQHAGLLFTGMFLTPLVPSINGRVALVSPLLGT